MYRALSGAAQGLSYDRHSETFHFLIESTATHQGQKPMVNEKRIVDKGALSVHIDSVPVLAWADGA
jgi:hypothetical protein